jgi:hypothetical protein
MPARRIPGAWRWAARHSPIGAALVGFATLAVLGAVVPFPRAVSTLLLVALFAWFVAAVLRRHECDWGTVGMVLGGIAVYVGYLSYTELTERNVDALIELDYIRFIAEQWRPPPPDHCSVCHHPPLYFLSAAVFSKLVGVTRLLSFEAGLQAWSLVCFVAFITFAILTFRRFSSRPGVIHLATALVIFWPGSILSTARVHNDILVWALMAGTLFFTVRWQQEDRAEDLYRAAVLSALGVLTKASAFAMVLVLLAVYGYRLVQKGTGLAQLKRTTPAFLVILAAALLAVSRKGPGATLCHRVLGVACNISSEHFVPNRLANYLYFDLGAFFGYPFFSSLAPNVDRNYFWNSLVKTSLFGTEVAADPELGYRLNAGLATIIDWLVLGMIVYALVGAFGVTRAGVRRRGVLLAASAAWLGSLALLRVMIPTPYHEDFRHVFPLVIPASLFFGELVDRYRCEKKALAWVGYLLSVACMLLSVLFFAPKQLVARSLTHRVIERPISAYATVRPQGTPRDAPGNLGFGPEDVIELPLPTATIVSALDLSLDSNDRYELELVGGSERRRMGLGPVPAPQVGLARYQLLVEPPVHDVSRLVLRPLGGDGRYALGHLVIPATVR